MFRLSPPPRVSPPRLGFSCFRHLISFFRPLRCPPNVLQDVVLLLELVSRLTDMGFITDKLAMPHGAYKPGEPQSYMGICKLKGEGRLHRRVDIKVYPT